MTVSAAPTVPHDAPTAPSEVLATLQQKKRKAFIWAAAIAVFAAAIAVVLILFLALKH